jgi:hypothetical protein
MWWSSWSADRLDVTAGCEPALSGYSPPDRKEAAVNSSPLDPIETPPEDPDYDPDYDPLDDDPLADPDIDPDADPVLPDEDDTYPSDPADI